MKGGERRGRVLEEARGRGVDRRDLVVGNGMVP